jgi:hypothetical protein
MKILTISLVVLAVTLAAGMALADVPNVISFQGVLTDDQDNYLDGTYSVTFRIYNVESGGTALWFETASVTCVDGLFDVLLGLTNPIDVDFGEPCWLGCTLAGDSEMTPRHRLASVPYAFWTAVADSATGVRWSNLSGMPAGFADGIDNTAGLSDNYSLDAADGDPVDVLYVDNDGNVGIGTTTPEAQLHVAGEANVIRMDHAGILNNPNFWITQNAYFDSSWHRISDGSPACGMAFNDNEGHIDFHTDTLTTGDPSLGNEQSLKLRIAGNGNVGIGTMNPVEKLHVVESDDHTAIKTTTYSGIGNYWSYFAGGRGRGSVASPGAVQENDMLVRFAGFGYGSSDWSGTRAAIDFRAEENWTDAAQGAFIRFNTTPTGSTSNPERMRITAEGNVGIGTDAPAYLLDVADTARMLGFVMPTGGSNGYVLTSNDSGVGTWQSVTAGADADWTVTGSDMYSSVSGNVGIGTSTPGSKLDVQGTVTVGADAAGHDVIFFGGTSGSRLIWNENRRSFRAGGATGTQWDEANLGNHSFATGLNTTASKWYSTAMGYSTTASGNSSTALGFITTASGSNSMAAGEYATAAGEHSIAIGRYVVAQADTSVTIGSGAATHLINNTANSMMVGFNTTTPTLFVGGPDHRVGIGTATPVAKLEVHGTLNVGHNPATGYDVNFYGSETGGRFFWDADKMALRAGRDTDGTHWAPDSVGQYSLAIGEDSKAVAENSIALGRRTWAAKSGAVAIGDYAEATDNGALALGEGTEAVYYSSAVGYSSEAIGTNSIAFGTEDNSGNPAIAVGDYSTAVGPGALADGEYGCSFGYEADAPGDESSAVGYQAYAGDEGSNAFGYSSNADGDYSTALGALANTGGIWATAIGRATSNGNSSVTLGKFITAQADSSMVIGISGSYVNGITNNVKNSLMVGFRSDTPTLFVGPSSGTGTTGNVGVGTSSPAAKLDVDGHINSSTLYMIHGDTVLYVNPYNDVTLLGVGAGANDYGGHGVAVGYKAGLNNNGSEYVFIGNEAGRDNAGDYNTFVGYQAGFSNIDGSDNTFVGSNAGNQNRGDANTFVGEGAGSDNDDGDDNTFVGQGAGGSHTGGDYNTFLGRWAGGSHTSGSSNTFLGASAGGYNITGERNVFVGRYAGYNETASDRLYIDSSDTSRPLIWGDFGANRVVINGNDTDNTNNRTLFVNGSAGGLGAWNNDSDVSLKKNIAPIPDALQKVQQLRGVNFEWKDAEARGDGQQMGFVAQEAVDIIPEVVSGDDGHYAMQYAPITALLVEAVKEQQNIIDEQLKRIEALESQVSALQ